MFILQVYKEKEQVMWVFQAAPTPPMLFGYPITWAGKSLEDALGLRLCPIALALHWVVLPVSPLLFLSYPLLALFLEFFVSPFLSVLSQLLWLPLSLTVGSSHSELNH